MTIIDKLKHFADKNYMVATFVLVFERTLKAGAVMGQNGDAGEALATLNTCKLIFATLGEEVG